MTPRQAQCSCGQLRLSILGDPERISVCHCIECQRRSGSVFGVQARFARRQVRMEGYSSQYVRTGDSGQSVTFHFCPSCGATVHWQLAEFPDAVVVAVGAFGDQQFPAPRVSVYEERRHPWVELPAALQREV